MGKLGKMKAEARKQAKLAGKVKNGALHGVKMAFQRLQGQGKAEAPQTTLHGQQQDQPERKKKKKKKKKTEKDYAASLRPPKTDSLPTAKKGGRQLMALPVDDVREELVKTVMAHQTTIVVGETGSGKSTRIPSYLERALNSGTGRVLHGRPVEDAGDGGTSSDEDDKKVYHVVCTQPRRVAATTIAERVASERGCRLGGDVGYTVRFDDCSGARTVVKYVTDGILLRESMTDPDLSNYDVVILDEAHERSLQTDVVMGILKMLQKRRRTLRIVVMSATLDVSIFSDYFMDCGHVNVPGRQFPVDVLYTKEREDDWKEGVLLTCLQIHEEEEPGGVLVFLPGQEDIEDLQQLLDQDLPSVIGRGPRPEVVEGDERDFEVVPLYARMPPEEQRKAFASSQAGVRKFILATNIAETSVTISGIKYVVDPGYHKTKLLVDDSLTGMEVLANRPISKSQANQRAGRAGRVSAGKCFRLFTEASFELLAEQSVPEIERVNLGQVCLQLMYQGIERPHKFPFISMPRQSVLKRAMQELVMLRAVQSSATTGMPELTRHGRGMADLPLTPLYANLLLKGVEYQCVSEMLSAIALLSTDTVFVQPAGQEAKRKRDVVTRQFFHNKGDFTTLVSVYDAWVAAGEDPAWCRLHYLNSKSMQRAKHVREQLCAILRSRKFDPTVSCLPHTEQMLRCLADGLQAQVARRISPLDPGGQMLKMTGEGGACAFKVERTNEIVYVHPSSLMHNYLIADFQLQRARQGKKGAGRGGADGDGDGDNDGKKIEWCVFTDMLMTKKKYIKNVAIIQDGWRIRPGQK